MQNLSIIAGAILFPAGETGIIESAGGLRLTADRKGGMFLADRENPAYAVRAAGGERV